MTLCIAMYFYFGNSMARVFRNNYKFLDIYMLLVLFISVLTPLYIVLTERKELINTIELFVAISTFVNIFVLAKLAKPEVLERAGWKNVNHWGES
jgi:hypothetical protein